MRFSYTASFVLWCVPVRNVSRKFLWWVFLPIALGVFVSIAVYGLGWPGPVSVLEPEPGALQGILRSLPHSFADIGIAAYLTLAGVLVLAGALRSVRLGRMSLPLRLRGTADQSHDAPDRRSLVRRVFQLLIASLVLVSIVQFGADMVLVALSDRGLPRIFAWPRGFPAWDWLSMLCGAAIAGFWGALIFGNDRAELSLHPRRFRSKDFALAVLMPLAMALLPRVLLKIFREFIFAAGGLNAAGFPPEWRELINFRPFPWIFVVFVLAWLEEFVLRECLQKRLTEKLGLKRSLFLVALLWWVLPIYNGFGPIPGLRIGVPGVSMVVSLLVTIAYNIPLGWLYARTQSLWPVMLMHGAMLLFRVGDSAYNFYLYHPNFYWIKSACWIFVGWYLFKKYPVEDRWGSAASASP